MSVYGGIEKILIVENAKTVRQVLRKILEMTGYEIFIADNNADALQIFMEHREISLVLFDVVIPGKGDKEVLDRIRELKPEVKVLLISSYPEYMMHEQGHNLEDVKFLAKPFYMNEFLSNVRELLDEG